MWEQSNWYESHNHQPKNAPLWLCVNWVPLITGPIFAAWGTYFATPTHYQSSFGAGTLTWWQRFFGHALTINCLGLLSPLLIFLSVGIPGIVANAGYMRAYHRQRQWQETYAQEAAFSQPMVQEAQAIWFDLLNITIKVCSVFAVWTVYAMLMCILYTYISWRLLSAVGRELKKSKDSDRPLGMLATTYILSECDRAPECHAERFASRAGGDDMELALAPRQIAHFPPSASGPASVELVKAALDEGNRKGAGLPISQVHGFDGVQNSKHNSDEDREAKDLLAPLTAPNNQNGSHRNKPVGEAPLGKGNSSTSFRALQRPNLTSTIRSFLPNIVPQKGPEAAPLPASRQDQIKELRKAFIHLLIQVMSISPACAIFMGLAIYLVKTVHGGIEQPYKGGNRSEFHWPMLILLVNWTTVFFGSVNLLAIAQRTYEPVFNSMHFSVTTFSGNQQQNAQTSAGSADMQSSKRRPSNGLNRILARKKEKRHGSSRARQIVSSFFETRTRQRQNDSSASRSGLSRLTSSEDQPRHVTSRAQP